VSTVHLDRRPKPGAQPALTVTQAKQVVVSMVRANNAKQASTDQLRIQMLQPAMLVKLASIKVKSVLLRASHACPAGTKM
jgi:hypothetical protein